MIQIYSPNFGVGAIRGWCLKYVDDAGNAPTRRPTAKSAFYAERDAGRISGSIDSPIGVWVVGFLDFTKGPFTKEGHVFFMKHLGGGKYEIRDSEVGAGARKTYGSLDELAAWFGAYSPKYIGWSTTCDGRQYAKEEETIMKPTVEQIYKAFKDYDTAPSDQQVTYYANRESGVMYRDLLGSSFPDGNEVKEAFKSILGQNPSKVQLEYYPQHQRVVLYKDLAGADKSSSTYEEVKETLYRKK